MNSVRALLLLGLLLGLLPLQAGVADSVLAEARRLELAGDFANADAQLFNQLKEPGLDAAARREIEFERERLIRIRKDYKVTKAALFDAIAAAVREVTEAEFEQWVSDGWFDGRVIDGEFRFVGPSVSNLFFRHAELNARRIQPPASSPEAAEWQNAMAIKHAAEGAGRPFVLPKCFRVRMTVTVKPDLASAGETLRAWLPVPRRYPFQDKFKLLASSPAAKQVAPATSPIRAAHFEQRARSGEATKFEIEYRYRAHGVWFDLRPEKIQAVTRLGGELKKFTREAPHIVFTDGIKSLSTEIAGGETNRMLKAKRFYDWIAGNIRYSFAREYSTLTNLGDYCLENRYGDCGQEALLFMTLCRFNGIPARWQSGWSIFPGAETIHDWCEIHLAPYGWVPVDPYMGIFAMRYATTLSDPQRRELRDFYFGGLTQYRMIANGDHNQPLSPKKNSFRSDDVDFQRGEIEVAARRGKPARNVYFDQFDYDLTWEEIAEPSVRR